MNVVKFRPSGDDKKDADTELGRLIAKELYKSLRLLCAGSLMLMVLAWAGTAACAIFVVAGLFVAIASALTDAAQTLLWVCAVVAIVSLFVHLTAAHFERQVAYSTKEVSL